MPNLKPDGADENNSEDEEDAIHNVNDQKPRKKVEIVSEGLDTVL